MKIIFMGAPGSGKGTQAELLSSKLKIPHISTGNMFRKEILNDTHLGKRIKSLMNAGEFVDDEITLDLVYKRISEPDCFGGYLLDGFPRNLNQARVFHGHIITDYVIDLHVDIVHVLDRVGGRWIHPSSGRTYHTLTNPPQVAGIDDVTGEPLIQRHEDSRAVVEHRITLYKEQTQPLMQFYSSSWSTSSPKYKVVDARGSISEVKQLVWRSVGIN